MVSFTKKGPIMFSKFFAFLFFISFSIFLFLWLNAAEPNKKQLDSSKYNKTTISIDTDIVDIFEDSKFIMMASLSTSLFSFFGFLLSLRSSRKEHALLDVQMERENLEVERLKAEINNLKS